MVAVLEMLNGFSIIDYSINILFAETVAVTIVNVVTVMAAGGA